MRSRSRRARLVVARAVFARALRAQARAWERWRRARAVVDRWSVLVRKEEGAKR